MIIISPVFGSSFSITLRYNNSLLEFLIVLILLIVFTFIVKFEPLAISYYDKNMVYTIASVRD